MTKKKIERTIAELEEANKSLAEGLEVEAILANAHKKTADRYFNLLCKFVYQFTGNLSVVANGIRALESLSKKCENPYGISDVELCAIARINGGIEPLCFIHNPGFADNITEGCTPTFIYELDNFGSYDKEMDEFVIDKTSKEYLTYRKRFDVYTIVYYLIEYPQRFDALFGDNYNLPDEDLL